MFLGVDGGGTKTAFLLLNPEGAVLARHEGGSSYHPEVGVEGLRAVLNDGVRAVLAQAGLTPSAIRHAFFGLPTLGEDPATDPVLTDAAGAAVAGGRYSCGNDMVGGWAGALACEDGIVITAGTGSIAYGEYQGRGARAGGWGEIFGDEGSAHWIGREGLALFSKMSDGRMPPGPLLDLVRARFQLARDIDLCGLVNRPGGAARSAVAQVSQTVAAAAQAGDAAATAIFVRAGGELARLAAAVRAGLGVPDGEELALSYVGGVFRAGALVLDPFAAALEAGGHRYHLQPPLLTPVVGAALYAARAAGIRFSREQVTTLASK
ncbi:N-acetylglucosamine kinase [Nitrospirillum amazonense]|uniref:N-acetylglucosamine kinase-like BadF-type ATPase n=1 Tax=Nitrospirillum amazonense TaxID=28077 RepID=A0A560JQT2_9PROT|nr:BadF/BadG/BcrA/BcrD ATPase family protein [Nitrospirillum amazonense]MDG3439636.1 BadF/BadG/BcrA/BcrD ATPase family protein [Nitrospirillum amazonense]TWB70680.1 N-acetylglucosamine kinase-like BadF-type ATPase [Nitrospirillum amazonense]